jgi:hypothetical protein
MTRHRPLIVLLEDNPANSERISRAIVDALPKSIGFARIEDEPTHSKVVARPRPYEDRLCDQLVTPKYAGLSMLVTDRDLSQSKRYPGLSEAVVSKVAARLGLPVCIYAAGQKPDSVLQRQRSGGDARIVLDSKDEQLMAHHIAVVAQGFLDVANALSKPLVKRLKTKTGGPAAIMAAILKRPEIADQLSLYATGDQKMIAELMPPRGSEGQSERRKRIPTVLGYWLFDSILHFPGIVVNEVAAASYLNINPKTFSGSSAIQKLFARALYEGPFSDPKQPRWWRDKLDDVLQQSKVEEGRALVQKQLGRSVKPCLDGKKRAGYYCVVTGRPVSKENSTGQISWLPRGADLSRVRQDVYDELAPWIGFS